MTTTQQPVLVHHVGVDDLEYIKNQLVQQAVDRLTEPVRDLIQGDNLWIAGGFLRSVLLGEPHADIDIFGPNPEAVKEGMSVYLRDNPDAKTVFVSENAATVMHNGEKLQFVWRDCRPTLRDTVNTFDFTICQAGFCDSILKGVQSFIPTPFLYDTADRRLVYTNPDRSQTPAAPYRRLLKFVAAGYRPDFKTMAGVMAPLVREAQAYIADESADSWSDQILKVLEQSRINGTY